MNYGPQLDRKGIDAIRKQISIVLPDATDADVTAFGLLLWTRAVAGPEGHPAFSTEGAREWYSRRLHDPGSDRDREGGTLPQRKRRLHEVKEAGSPTFESAFKRLAHAQLVTDVPAPETYRLSSVAEKLPLRDLAEQIGAPWTVGSYGMVLSDVAMRELVDTIQRIGASPGIIDSMLVHGESGTGKELVARAIHYANPMRRYGPFIAVNCAGIPASLFEAELFGHRRGAFTGATEDRPGLFEMADGGTLFLDEVTEMDMALQSKLLRVLQERVVQRIGASVPTKIDVLVVAVTNREPDEELRGGRLRRDVYHRLANFEMRVPALRERRDDIPRLVTHILKELEERSGIKITIEGQGLEILCDHAWPGNVRELQQVLRRAVIVTSGRITSDVIQRQLVRVVANDTNAPTAALPDRAFRVEVSGDRIREVELHYRAQGDKVNLKSIVETVEREICTAALAQSSSSLRAARLLGLSPQGMLNKIKRYRLQKHRRSKD